MVLLTHEREFDADLFGLVTHDGTARVDATVFGLQIVEQQLQRVAQALRVDPIRQ